MTVVVKPVTSFFITKTVSTEEPYYVGSPIEYQIVVTNDGDTVIIPIVADDKGTKISGPVPNTASIAPGATWTFVYQATPSEVGNFTNIATAEVGAITEQDSVTVTVNEIIILRIKANLAKEPGTDFWNLHAWARTDNTSSQIFEGSMRIKSHQESSGITEWYPSETEYAAISITPGKSRNPSGSDYWLMDLVGEGSNKPTDVFVEIWIFDTNGNLVSYKIQNI